jgi:hypothetical protein
MRENAGDSNPGHAAELPGFPVPGAKLAWTTLPMLATRNRVGRIVPEYAKASNEQDGGQLNLSDNTSLNVSYRTETLSGSMKNGLGFESVLCISN